MADCLQLIKKNCLVAICMAKHFATHVAILFFIYIFYFLAYVLRIIFSSRGRKNYVKFFAASRFVNGCRNSNLMNSNFCMRLFMQCKKLWYFRKQNILRGRENYVEYFTINRFINGYRNSNLMNSNFYMWLFMQYKKCDILEKNILRERENYIEFFTISRFVNGCWNSNLMNSKIVTFASHYSHSVKKLRYFKKQNISQRNENYVKFLCSKKFYFFTNIILSNNNNNVIMF